MGDNRQLYKLIVMLLVSHYQITSVTTNIVSIFAPIINETADQIIDETTIYNELSTTTTAQPTTIKSVTTESTAAPSTTIETITQKKQVNETTNDTTEKTTTTADPQELLIPPATVNASIAQMFNVSRQTSPIIIRYVKDIIIVLV